MEKVNIIIYVDNIKSVNSNALKETITNLKDHCCITVIDDGCSISEDSSISFSNVNLVKNSSFMGFSKSCNKVIASYKNDNDILVMTGGYLLKLENVEEMKRVLYSTEHNGAVIPRSNTGVFARYPYINSANVTPESIETSYKCFKNTNKYLKDFNTVPYPYVSVILIKKLLLDNWGEFCESLNSPISAIKVLCEEMNKPGFSTVLANHTFVPDYTGYINPYDQVEKEAFESCYGYVDKITEVYEDMSGFYNIFSRVLDTDYYSKKRILVAIMDMPQDRTRLNYIDQMVEELKECEITLLTTEELDKELSLSDKYSNVKYYSNIEGQFHAGIIFMEKFFPEMFYIVSKVCIKMAVLYYDRTVLEGGIDNLDQVLNYRMQKSIFQYADIIAADDKEQLEDLEMIFGNNKKVNNVRMLIDRQNTACVAEITKELLDMPLDNARICQINLAQKYIWSSISGLNNIRLKFGTQHNILNNINNIIKLSIDDKTKLEAINNLQMES